MSHPLRPSRAVPVAALLLLAAAACGSEPPPTARLELPPVRGTLPSAYRPSGHAAAGDVFVHLFEWRWTDIASECEAVLGPAGYRAVQVSPPQEHALVTGAPWWQRYQPVSYSLARSRSGTRAEFVDMVTRCRAANVDVYVDAVINHMTAGAGTGSAGTTYTKYEYPGLWTRAEFRPACEVNNYQSAANVQDCELLGLADLDTRQSAVRQKVAAYLIELSRLGVAGFRIDAAKHIQPVELDSIVAVVNTTLAAEGRPRPYFFAEVIDPDGEAVSKRDYFGLGFASGGAADITEFKARLAADKFLGLGGQRLAQLNPTGAPGSQFSEVAWGLMPSDKAVVFLENHDTQRESGIWYRNGQVYRLANVWLLAQPYGYPSVLSGYALERGSPGRDAGPPSDAAGNTTGVACAASLETAAVPGWMCEHRDAYLRAMVGFRRATAGTASTQWWDNGGNAIAFSRGARGFVAINREATPVTVATSTGLPVGTYCNVLGAPGPCSSTVRVEAGGAVSFPLAANSAVALHVGAPGVAAALATRTR